MVLAIPGGRVLFSVLQHVLRAKCDHGTRVRLSHEVHRVLADFRWLAVDLTARPKRMAEVIPKATPDTLGAQDAAAFGMGASTLSLKWMAVFNASLEIPLPRGDPTSSH
jgi:hypothetical protein